ncbi:flavin reductase family protein [Brevibacterium litoralis]|uniref:flavin reductase family protein n=1 Tax=Brevibacterium litoralis TaxID=3138935 RepID=UPI0032EBB2BB
MTERTEHSTLAGGDLAGLGLDVSAEHAEVSPQRMREVMGSFGSGVTVVTAQTPDGPTGFTCQSFTSLSLEPPLITFNPARSSSTWPRLREVGSFTVNVLGAHQDHLSNQFARSGTDKFAGISFTRSARGNPRLDDAVAWIDCTLHREYDGGDHTIVVGRVEALVGFDHLEPLLFVRGGYHAVESARAPASCV